jgi:hypothetical protein
MGELARLMSEVIWQLPNPSQEFNQGPQILVSNGRVTLRWDHETEDGSYAWSSAEFVGVEDAEFIAQDSCSPDHAEAYDRLLKIEPSARLEALRGSSTKFLQHFRIYFDDIGCLEIVAEDFVPPAQP